MDHNTALNKSSNVSTLSNCTKAKARYQKAKVCEGDYESERELVHIYEGKAIHLNREIGNLPTGTEIASGPI